jgi:hypothetical protein
MERTSPVVSRPLLDSTIDMCVMRSMILRVVLAEFQREDQGHLHGDDKRNHTPLQHFRSKRRRWPMGGKLALGDHVSNFLRKEFLGPRPAYRFVLGAAIVTEEPRSCTGFPGITCTLDTKLV